MKRLNYLYVVAITGLLAGSLQAAPSEHFKVFLCFGQSNMSGGAGCSPDAASQQTTPRVLVLAFANCGSPSRTADTWSDAREPMHCGDGVSSMGPSYVFGQKLAEALPNDTIGLIPAGLWGVSIEEFMRGKSNTSGNKPSMIGNNAWDWMVTKCKKAMERGVFSGIILHQGESNSGDGTAWLTKVKSIYDDLKTTLPLDKDVPFVAGELLTSGDGKGLNPTIDKIPQTLPKGYVASAQGLSGGGQYPNLHFNTPGYRTLGERYAVEMLKGLPKTDTKLQPQRIVSVASVKSQRDNIKVYSLSGRFISTGAAMTKAASLRPGSIYVVANKTNGAALKLMIAPTAN
jgi:hypothetical protein